MSDTPRGRVAVANAPAFLIRVENAFATKDCLCVATSIARACSSYNEPAKGCSIRTMKTTVRIVEVRNFQQVEGKDFTTTLVNIKVDSPVPTFKKDEDGEKKLVNSKELCIRLSEFKDILVLDQSLALLEEAKGEKLEDVFKFHCLLLKGAKLVISKEDVMEKPTDDEGNVIEGAEEVLVGFGETKFQLELTQQAKDFLAKLLDKQLERMMEEMMK